MSDDPADIEAMRAELAALRLRVADLTQQLAESEEKAEQLGRIARVVDESTDMIGISDLASRVLFINRGGRAMMGYGADEDLSGLMVAETIPERLRPFMVNEVKPALLRDGTWRGEGVVRCRDGSEIPALYTMTSHRGPDGEVLYNSVITRDIRELKRLSDELRKAEERLRHLLRASPMVIYSAQASGSYGLTFVSDSVRELFGYEPHQFTDDPRFWGKHLHPGDAPRILAETPRVFELGQNSYEYRFRHSDGSYRWVYDHHKLVPVADGGPVEIVGSILDITERKEAEQAVLELSTPLIPVSDRVLAMPLVGRVNQARAGLVLTKLLEGIGRARAEVAILDITGVERVDEGVASALIAAAQAVQLLGAEVVITGIRPEVAQSLVRMGIDLGRIATRGSLSAGIAYAARLQR
jgi:rsbT co-antagonist protein RsbR